MSGFFARMRVILEQSGFAGLLGSAFALGIGFSFVGPFLSLWGTNEIGMSPSMFGLYMTVTSLSAILVATSLARWSDTHVPRKVMLLLGAGGDVLLPAVRARAREVFAHREARRRPGVAREHGAGLFFARLDGGPIGGRVDAGGIRVSGAVPRCGGALPRVFPGRCAVCAL